MAYENKEQEKYDLIIVVFLLLIIISIIGIGFIYTIDRIENEAIIKYKNITRNDIQIWNNNKSYNNFSNLEIRRNIGVSMSPTITHGDYTLCDYDIKNYQIGMIINYQNITHRIKGMYENYLVVQGDNNIYSENINYSDINCVVVGVLY